MMEYIDVSIVVPVCNAQNYIKRLVETLVKFDKITYEIHLVENNSSDNTYQILEQIKKTYQMHNIHIYSIDAKSSGEALNFGLKKVKGKYVYMCDADDEVITLALEREINQIKEITDCIYDVISCKYITINKTKVLNIKPEINEFTNTYWNKIYLTNFLKSNNIKFIEGINVQDGCFNTDVLNCLPKIYYSSTIIYKYHIGVDSISDVVSLKTLNGFLESNKKQQKSILLCKRGLNEIEIHKYYRILVSQINKSMFLKYGKMSMEEIFFFPSYIGWKKKGISYIVYIILLNQEYDDFLILQKEYTNFLKKIGYDNQRNFLFDYHNHTTKIVLFNYYKFIITLMFKVKNKIVKKECKMMLLQMSKIIKDN